MNLDSGQRRALWISVGLAFALRLGFLLFVAPNEAFGDLREYVTGAERLLAGEPLPVRNVMHFVRAPGYSLFLAAVWKLTGTTSLLAVKVVQAVLSALTCLSLFHLTRVFFPSAPKAPWIAFAGAALYPYFIFQAAVPSSETLFAFLVATGTLFFARGLQPDTPVIRDVALGSTLLTIGNLVRPNWSVVLPFLAAWIIWRWRRAFTKVLRVGFAMAIPYFGITGIWVYDVWAEGQGLVWVSDGGGVFYYMGHNDLAHELYCEDISEERRRELLHFPGRVAGHPAFVEAAKLPAAERIPHVWAAAKAWDVANMDKNLCLGVARFGDFWSPWVNVRAHGWLRAIVSVLTSGPVLLLGLAGIVLARRRGERVLTTIVGQNLAAGTFVAVVFSTAVRYRLPIIDLLLFPFFGYAAAVGLAWIRRRPEAGLTEPDPIPIASGEPS